MLNGQEYRDWICKHMSMGKDLLYLSEAECRALPLDDQEVFDLTERALILYSARQGVDMPAKIAVLPLGLGNRAFTARREQAYDFVVGH